MKISSIQNNNQAFRGVILEKNIRPEDMKKVINPCLNALKDLSDNVNITLSSSSVLQKCKNFVSPRPAIDIAISPKNEANSAVSFTKLSMPIYDYKTGSEELFDLIKTVVRNIFY